MAKKKRFNYIDTLILRDGMKRAEEDLIRLQINGGNEDDIIQARGEVSKEQILLNVFNSINAETRRESESRRKQNRL